ncbi:EF hand domain-containing protein [Besnoitia besnoiti]|uniref:EF hand domain-containing protein n=1 Tax=Besnoitia besnoiti TaxID=94643 RepID=A0A2A9MDD7_BESBE|nr:EF hand domain-containing protein [Besnoitia besnoiti]PFH35889.1 EF hand domain-containing protein [Besnoitia besnoiti]
MGHLTGWPAFPAQAKAAKPAALLLAIVLSCALTEALPYSRSRQHHRDPHYEANRTAMIQALEGTFSQASTESTRESVENWLIIGLFLFITACSLIFELVFDTTEEFLERTGMKPLLKMLHGAYKELTILGFITLTLFAAVRLGQMQKVNDQYLGVSEIEAAALRESEEAGESTSPPTHLTEVFEEVHILIFVVMSLFILAAAVITLSGYRLLRKYEYMDAKSETDLRNDVTTLQTTGGVREQHVDESLEYWALRERFLHPTIPLIPRPRARETGYPQFSFSSYISSVYGDIVSQMVELPPSVIITSFLIILLLRPALDLKGREVIAFMILVAFALLGMTTLAMVYIRYVNDKLRPDAATLRAFFGEGRASSDQNRQALTAPIDESGYINFDQFKALIMLLGQLGVAPEEYQAFQENRLQKLFRSLDTDSDNKIVRPNAYSRRLSTVIAVSRSRKESSGKPFRGRS